MWKRDEMEQQIYDKSARITWQLTIIILIILGFYQNQTTGGNNLYIFIANLSILSQVFLDRFYFSKVTNRKNFLKFIALALFLAFILISITIWFVI